MKFLIFGSNKKYGHMVAIYLAEQGHEVTCFEKPRYKGFMTIDGDIYERNLIKEIISKGGYDTVVYCDTIVNEFAEEDKESAAYTNSYMPHYLAKLTKDMTTKVITVSTDCVFSGTNGKYTEFDFKDGVSFYAKSKALGELIDEKNFTIRTSLVGPDINADGIGLLNWFMKQTGQISGYTKAMWTGITTLQLAKIIERAAQENAVGLENMVPDRTISKYELLSMFNKYFRQGRLKIIENSSYAVDKSLIRSVRNLNFEVPDYEIMFNELKDWLKNHKEYYPHYF